MTLRDWSAVASAWNEHFDWNTRCFQPFVDWFAEVTAPRDGMRVLDVAGGTGFPSIPLARRFPRASFVSTDLSPAMVEFAEQRATTEGLTNIEFGSMDAHAMTFSDASFDIATCSFGLMLCEHPAKVVREMRRVVKPGGSIAITVWDTPTRNPFLGIFGRAIVSAGLIDRPERTSPGPFRFADVSEFTEVLRAGGVRNSEITACAATVTYESIDAYLDMAKQLAPNAAEKLALASPDQVAAIDTSVRAEARPFVTPQGLELAASALCARGAA